MIPCQTLKEIEEAITFLCVQSINRFGKKFVVDQAKNL